MRLLLPFLLLGSCLLTATEHSGSVRAADQFIPGATVTARNGGAKVVAYTWHTVNHHLVAVPSSQNALLA